jgi:ketosteroid isomerase-like protein
MAIKTHTNARKLLLTCLIILMLVSTGCQQQASRTVSADEVKKLSTVLDQLSDKAIQAYNSHDLDQVRQVYTEDVLVYESNEKCNGVDCMLHTADWIFSNAPQFGIQKRGDAYISGEDGFLQQDFLNFSAIPENPIIHSFVWVKPQEGKASYWRSFVSSDFFTSREMPFDPTILNDYTTAWSSGDAQTVADLYNTDAVREDSLFGENQQGSSAMKDFAADFVNKYPGISLELLQSFGETGEVKTLGGVYAMHVTDQNSKPCDVQALIVLEPNNGKISKETVFYQPDSLIACGWAR